MDLEAVERQRTALEGSMDKLRQSVQYWQDWESEYEGLQGEVKLLEGDITPESITQLVTDLDSRLLTGKEIRDIFGLARGHIRSSEQVIGLLGRRIDYVRENVASLQKQSWKAEGCDQASGGGRERGDDRNEEGLPVTEIFEELDEDGNVLSSRISHPADNAEGVIASLRKAGVKDVDAHGREPEVASSSPAQDRDRVDPLSHAPKSSSTQPQENARREEESDAALPPAESAEQNVRPGSKRSVSFAEGTKEKSEEEKPFSTRHTLKSSRSIASPIVKQALPNDGRVWEVDENDKPINFTSPHIPVDESPENAQLRREMLQYSMNEVGAIVAELELEEGGDSDDTYSVDDDDEMSGTSDDSDEDVHGMSRRSHLTDEYRDEMTELEKKLNAQMVQNIGPRPDAHEIRNQVRVAPSSSNSQNPANKETAKQKNESPARKGVRFADDLNIAPKQESATKPLSNTNQPRPSPAEVVSDSIVERNVPKPAVQPAAPTPPKMSKFKAARLAAANSASTQPTQRPDAPIATNVVERPPRQANGSHAPPEAPAELDPELLKRQVQADYYRQRSRLIKKQGGYKNSHYEDDDDHDDEDELNEEEDMSMITESAQTQESTPSKKVSLFKAARVNAGRAW